MAPNCEPDIPGVSRPGAPDPLAWQGIDSEAAYQGFLRVESRRYWLPDGRITRWDILAGGCTVSLVAVTQAGRIVLARQYRPGPDQVLAELPGGMVDPGEGIAGAAARELLEETGYEAGEVRPLGATWLAGFSTIHKHSVLATGCRRVGLPAGGGDEFCQPVEVDRAEFLALLRRGDLTDAESAYRGADELGWLGNG